MRTDTAFAIVVTALIIIITCCLTWMFCDYIASTDITYEPAISVTPCETGVSYDRYNALVLNYNSLADDYNLLINMSEPEPVIQTVYIEPRYFSNVTELKAWLAEDHTESVDWTPSHNCCKFSRELQYAAAQDGYIISQERMDSVDGGHRLCMAYLSETHTSVYIEPQNDQVWFAQVENI